MLGTAKESHAGPWSGVQTLDSRGIQATRWLVLAGSVSLTVFAVLLGWAASTPEGLLVDGGLVGIAFLIGVAWAFQRDGPAALLGFWFLQLLLVPASALVGYGSPLGSAIRQGNDVITAVFVLMCVWKLLAGHSRIGTLRYAIAGGAVAICGLVSSLVAGGGLTVTAEGAWLGLKMWTLIAIALCVPWRARDVQRNFKVFQYSGIVVALTGILDYATHGGVAMTLHTNIVTKGVSLYRADAVQAIFTNPGEYSLAMSLFFAIGLASYVVRRHRTELASVVLFAIAIALALRLKGALDIGAAIAVVVVCPSRLRQRKKIGILVLAAVLVLGVVSFEGDVLAHQISSYTATSSGSTARGLLYDVSGQIAVGHFPLGVGFGRYASYTSGSPYSTVYDQYGLSDVWGLSRQYPLFISDTSWPSVLGETGVIGLISFLGGLVAIWIAAYRRFRRGPIDQEPVALALLCALAVLAVDSLGDPNLFDWFAVTTIALLVGPVFAGSRVTRGQDGPAGLESTPGG
jgi:hypothetical protein